MSAMSGGQAGYYLGLAREDYYLQGGEPPGRWHGLGAATLGLSGQVEPDQLYNLFDGLSPDGSRRLIRLQQHDGKAAHRPGWDLTFSAPKSVSVLWSQSGDGNRAKIQQAHAAAVEAALSYLQDTAALTRRGVGGKSLESTGLVVAAFEHSTSRALDPQLHTHCLVMNLGTRDDGTTGTVSSPSLFQAKMAAGALYRAELSARLELDLGLRLERKGSWFEAVGVPQSLIDHFSKRREAIEAQLKTSGLNSAQAAATAAIQTRDAKEAVSRQEMLGSWARDGAAHGWDRDRAERLFGGFGPPRERALEGMYAAERAVKRITESSAHFTERDLVRFAAEEAQARGIGAADVLNACKGHLARSPDIVRLGRHFGHDRFTTKAMLRLEASLLDEAAKLSKDVRLMVPPQGVDRTLTKHAGLSSEQAEALRHIAAGTGGLAVVSGMAGTGKTRMLDAARQTWEAQGLKVKGAALAARAAGELKDGASIESETIAKLLVDIERGRFPLDPKTVLVVDEAGMVATPDMERLLRHVRKAGAKLVLVGDERQLQPIGPGAPMRELGQRFGQAELSDIRRQSEAWARQAVKDLASGNSREALEAFASRGLVRISGSGEEAMRELVAAWRGDALPLKDTLIIAGTQSEVRALNRLAQRARLEGGELSGPEFDVQGTAVYVGDRVMFTRNHKKLGIVNGARGTVADVSGDGERMGVRLDSGERVSVETFTMKDMALGYASTTHKSQGATATRAYVLAGGGMQDRELSYVQGSRARERTTFFVPANGAGDEVEQLAVQMERSRQKDMAHRVRRPSL